MLMGLSWGWLHNSRPCTYMHRCRGPRCKHILLYGINYSRDSTHSQHAELCDLWTVLCRVAKFDVEIEMVSRSRIVSWCLTCQASMIVWVSNGPRLPCGPSSLAPSRLWQSWLLQHHLPLSLSHTLTDSESQTVSAHYLASLVSWQSVPTWDAHWHLQIQIYRTPNHNCFPGYYCS